MTRTRSSVFVASLLCVCAVAGCSDSDTPTENDYDDVAQALGGVTATGDGGGEIGTLFDAAAIVRGSPTGLDVKASGEFSSARFDMLYDYSASCTDAAGVALDRCGADTDAAEIRVTWSGELATPVISASVDREGTLSISDIQSDVVTIGGESDLAITARFDSLFRRVSREYSLSYHAEYSGVTVNTNDRAITAGRATYALAVERMATTNDRESSASFDIDAELVFGADGGATLTLDGAHSYAIDPDSGAVTKM